MLELNKTQELYKINKALDAATKAVHALADVPAAEYAKVTALVREAQNSVDAIRKYRNEQLKGVTERYYPGTSIIDADDLTDTVMAGDGFRVRIVNLITNEVDNILCAPVDDGYPDNSKFSAMKQGQVWFANWLKAHAAYVKENA